MKRMVVAVMAALLGVVGLGALALTTTSAASAAPAVARPTPTPTPTPTQWKFVATGGEVTCAIDLEQKLWCWGLNDRGQVGDGTEDNRAAPVRVDGSDWLTVRTSYDTTCGIKTDHTAWCWGQNVNGTFGNGTYDSASTPQKVSGPVKWAKITSGFSNTCGISTTGALYCTGFDGYGGLGDGDSDGTGNSNESTTTMRRVGTASSWDTVTVGWFHACALKTNGKAFCWGGGAQGSLGTGNYLDAPSPVALPGAWKSVNTVAFTTCGVSSTGVSKCWGANGAGQVGDGTEDAAILPTRLAVGSRDFVRVRPGADHSCGITAAGGVRCFGDNTYGQFGNGTYDASPTPVVAAGGKLRWSQLAFGDHHVCGIRNGGRLFCWGSGRSGALGTGGYPDEVNVPVEVGVIRSGRTDPPSGRQARTPVPTRPSGPAHGEADPSAPRQP